MLPLHLLKGCSKNPILVEVKSGETFNGLLIACDSWMNMNLVDVICTSASGDKFWKIPECHIKGITVKYIRIPDEVLDQARETNKKLRMQQAEIRNQRRNNSNSNRGGRSTGRGSYNNSTKRSSFRKRQISLPAPPYGESIWSAVYSWHWGKTSEDDICGICQAHFECSCANCPIPGNLCPLVVGKCLHAFHEHCIVDWIKLQKEKSTGPPRCPLCRQEWNSEN